MFCVVLKVGKGLSKKNQPLGDLNIKYGVAAKAC